MPSVLQDWVQQLGLRHQGSLLTAVRGCDVVEKLHPTKALARCFREAILNPHCGDARKAATFIEKVDYDELERRMENFRKNYEQLPLHYVMHVLHAAEIVAYKHPSAEVRQSWSWFYHRTVRSLHLNPETEEQLDARLNADEQTFAKLDRLCELDLNPKS
jgi:hypothetical protein